jgi:hypothetical protein
VGVGVDEETGCVGTGVCVWVGAWVAVAVCVDAGVLQVRLKLVEPKYWWFGASMYTWSQPLTTAPAGPTIQVSETVWYPAPL